MKIHKKVIVGWSGPAALCCEGWLGRGWGGWCQASLEVRRLSHVAVLEENLPFLAPFPKNGKKKS